MVQYRKGIYSVLFQRNAYVVYEKETAIERFERLGLAIRYIADMLEPVEY